MMFALCALVALSEAGERLFLPSVRYGQPVSAVNELAELPVPVAPQPQVVYYADPSVYPAYQRAPGPKMSGDGEHETLYEMFDIGWVIVSLGIYGAVLLKFALG